MSRTERQRRWRQRQRKKPIQVYLHEDTVKQLDAIADRRESSRARVLAELIGWAAGGTDEPVPVADTDTPDLFDPGNGPEAAESGTQSKLSPTRAAEGSAGTETAQARGEAGCGVAVTPDAAPGQDRSVRADAITYKKTGPGAYAVYIEGACVGRTWKDRRGWCAAASDATLWHTGKTRERAVIAMLAAQGW